MAKTNARPHERIADILSIGERYLRSVNLERDFEDPSAIAGYVLMPQAAAHIDRILGGLVATSGRRAWRITGDYGVGKSSFALILAHLLCAGPKNAKFRRPASLPSKHRLLPVLVTGSREPIAVAVLRRLVEALLSVDKSKARDKLIAEARRLDAANCNDKKAIELIADSAAFLSALRKGSGLLLVIDELGKFLEFAASNNSQQDVLFLQTLAETAARSRESTLVVVGLLHQGFGAYASQLTQSAQREWQKVAGRYEELILDRPIEQTAVLVADALGVSVERIPLRLQAEFGSAIERLAELGWYGRGAEAKELRPLGSRLFPLHPTVIPVLGRILARFGQNERSLFGFLFAHEPFGLSDFAGDSIHTTAGYRLSDLYNYVRANFGSALGLHTARSHWTLIESVVESCQVENQIEARVLRTVAMLNLVDDQGLLATDEAIVVSVANGRDERSSVEEAIKRLAKLRVIYTRGKAGGYCLWPHTSIDIDAAYDRAGRAIGEVESLARVITEAISARPLVARRHYIETGNLRHFEVRLVEPTSIEVAIKQKSAADGLVVIPLCETAASCRDALAFAATRKSGATVLIGVPPPLETLRAVAIEASRWRWVAENTPELVNDRIAAAEVTRQVELTQSRLEKRVQEFVGFRSGTSDSQLTWFFQGKRLALSSGRDLLQYVSTICDAVYSKAPLITNELINRREISSAAAQARSRLIDGLLTRSDQPLFGMDTNKKPPEMSMYLSILKQGLVHVAAAGLLQIREPNAGKDPLRISPTLERIREILARSPGGKASAATIFGELRTPPFGIRDGLLPLLLAIFTAANEDEIAVYEDGTFLRSVSSPEFMRLAKVPDSFVFQLCRVTGVRASVFAELATVLTPSRTTRSQTVVDVARAICRFAADLPPTVRATKKLTAQTRSVLSTILVTREPASLLFVELPRACGFEAFDEHTPKAANVGRAFVESLRAAVGELRAWYPELLASLRGDVNEVFGLNVGAVDPRTRLAEPARELTPEVHEPRLRGFCMRLADATLDTDAWTEALASFVCGKPPAHWLDHDRDRFRDELARLARQYSRVEATHRELPSAGSLAVRVALTRSDGSDLERILTYAAGDEVELKKLESKIEVLIQGTRELGLMAASRVLWRGLDAVPGAVAES